MIVSYYYTGKGTDEDPYIKQYRNQIGEIYVKNLPQKAIYECELLGQLADGIWENDDLDWNFWHCLSCEVSATKFGWIANRIPDRLRFNLYLLNDMAEDIKNYVALYQMGYDYEYTKEVSDILYYYGRTAQEFEEWKNKILIKYPDKNFPDIEKFGELRYNYTTEMMKKDIEELGEAMSTSIKKIGFI